jgi:hypothetical protein
MSLSINDDMESRQLLVLFVQELRKRLEGDVLTALKPAIDKAIDGVVAELNPAIQKHYDMRCDRMVHNLMVTRREETK